MQYVDFFYFLMKLYIKLKLAVVTKFLKCKEKIYISFNTRARASISEENRHSRDQCTISRGNHVAVTER